MGDESRDGNAQLRRHVYRGRVLPFRDDEQLGAKIGEVELELVGAIAGIERRRGGRRSDRQERGRHLRAVVQHDADAVARPDAADASAC
jgi:hypothetical protein